MVSSHAVEGWTSSLDRVCSGWLVAQPTTISLQSALVRGPRRRREFYEFFWCQNFWH